MSFSVLQMEPRVGPRKDAWRTGSYAAGSRGREAGRGEGLLSLSPFPVVSPFEEWR